MTVNNERYQGIIIDLNDDDKKLTEILHNVRLRNPPINLCHTVSDLKRVFPANDVQETECKKPRISSDIICKGIDISKIKMEKIKTNEKSNLRTATSSKLSSNKKIEGNAPKTKALNEKKCNKIDTGKMKSDRKHEAEPVKRVLASNKVIPLQNTIEGKSLNEKQLYSDENKINHIYQEKRSLLINETFTCDKECATKIGTAGLSLSKKKSDLNIPLPKTDSQDAKMLKSVISDQKREIKDLKNKIIHLERERENDKALIADLSRTSLDLQQNVINEFQGMCDFVRDLRHANKATASPDGAHYSVGFLDRSKFIIHVGRGEWIPANQWDCCYSLCEPVKFVRELARYLFGVEALRNCTITGRVSNKIVAQNPTKRFGKLDPKKIEAIRENRKTSSNKKKALKNKDYDSSLNKSSSFAEDVDIDEMIAAELERYGNNSEHDNESKDEDEAKDTAKDRGYEEDEDMDQDDEKERGEVTDQDDDTDEEKSTEARMAHMRYVASVANANEI